MPATNQEINAAKMEHLANSDWEVFVDVVLRNRMTLDRFFREYTKLRRSRLLWPLLNWKFPALAMLVNLGTKRVIIEAVRRGLLKEQNLDDEQSQ